MRRSLIGVTVLAMLAGCATPPEGAGRGYGAEYTPVIDMRGVDAEKYDDDLGDCRAYAAQIDPAGRAAAGAIAGALAGALLSAAAGGHGYYNRQNAGLGAVLGAGTAGADGLRDAKTIIMRCMIGRGYNVLG